MEMDDSHTVGYFDGNRYYDPSGGKYISESAGGYLTGATNLYIFANNTPVDRQLGEAGEEVFDTWDYIRKKTPKQYGVGDTLPILPFAGL